MEHISRYAPLESSNTGKEYMPQRTERVVFRLIITPCCGQALCWVNPRFPNYCPECGKRIFPQVKENVTFMDDEALLMTKEGT